MPKTLTVQDAEQQLATATATVDQLKAKILDHGPGSVTAEELGQAALAVEHAKLTVQHATEAASAEAKRQRQEQLEELKARILADAGDVDTALDAMRQIEQAAALLIATCTGRQKLIRQATLSLRQAGVPRYEPGGKTRITGDGRVQEAYTQLSEEHAHMGWSEASMGRSDEVHIDDRRLTHVGPGLLIAVALERAANQAGRSVQHLAPSIDMKGSYRDAATDPEAWLKARY